MKKLLFAVLALIVAVPAAATEAIMVTGTTSATISVWTEADTYGFSTGVRPLSAWGPGAFAYYADDPGQGQFAILGYDLSYIPQRAWKAAFTVPTPCSQVELFNARVGEATVEGTTVIYDCGAAPKSCQPNCQEFDKPSQDAVQPQPWGLVKELYR